MTWVSFKPIEGFFIGAVLSLLAVIVGLMLGRNDKLIPASHYLAECHAPAICDNIRA
jgi:hypothetical protein